MDHGYVFHCAQRTNRFKCLDRTGTSIDSGTSFTKGPKLEKLYHRCFFNFKNCTIDDNATIYSHCIIQNATLESFAAVGPFAHIHEKSIIQEKSSYWQLCRSQKNNSRKRAKAKHLSYLGDTKIGKRVNVGAGTITCNYDGTDKFKTIIEDDVFIGSNNTLIAPLSVKT